MPQTQPHYNFNHLSVKDLVEARDMFHVHLINKKNVVATAVGRYLIRKSDLDENGKYKSAREKKPRTLENSIVTDISWPCVLVFVDTWQNEEELIKTDSGNITNIIPKTIYMPDGRIIPVCVVLATKVHTSGIEVDYDKLRFPSNYFGPGFPAIIHLQGQDNLATIGCIVSDGHKYFVLTNKHLTGGNAGEIIKSMQGVEKMDVGFTTEIFIGKKEFSLLYPGWQNNNVIVSCDAGLIEIDDIKRWKTELPFIGAMDEMYDLNVYNISLGLIAEHAKENNEIKPAENGNVIGYGAVSGLTEGEIIGMFYRHKSVGGTEYVSDFLIGGRNGESLNIHHGDSGSLWLIETFDENKGKKLQPIALHWGQHLFLKDSKKTKFTFSLSTSLSNICRELDIDLVRGWNIDNDYSWGKIGHYTVGYKAIYTIQNANLRKLMNKNERNISFRKSAINKNLDDPKIETPGLSNDPDKGFCALADVPDIIWKQYKLSADGTKGTKWGRKGDENPNHYADADAVTVGDGKTLFDLCNTQDKMTTDVWNDYYKNIDKEKIGLTAGDKISKGLICFRVWQIFDYMVDAINNGKKDQFIFAAGVLAHYVGDACQPLHSSYMSDGNPKDNTTIMYTPTRGGSVHPKGVPYEKVVNPGTGVHVAYEDHMIDDFIGDILPAVTDLLDRKTSVVNKEPIVTINSGQSAAFAVLQLMRLTQQELSPLQIVEAFKAAKGSESISQALFDKFKDQTINVLARGSRYLGAIWEAAWEIAGGDTKITDLSKVDEKDLIALYREPSVLPSMNLDNIKTILSNPG